MHAVLPALIAWIASALRSRAAMQLEILVMCLLQPIGHEVGHPPAILRSNEIVPWADGWGSIT